LLTLVIGHGANQIEDLSPDTTLGDLREERRQFHPLGRAQKRRDCPMGGLADIIALSDDRVGKPVEEV